MDATPPINSALPKRYGISPLFLALVAAGLIGNYFKLSIFLNIDFIFGSIFAMLVLQFFGRGRGIAAAAIIAGYTYILWNHPYNIFTMTVEVVIVGWLMERRKMGMVLADTLYWLIIGMPLVYLFYHFVMHVPSSNTYIVMVKQALNGIANALVARLIFTGYAIRSRALLISYRETIYNLLALFLLCPALALLAVSSRTDFAEMDRHIRNTLMHESRHATLLLENRVLNIKNSIVNLAELAADKSPQQMQPYLEQVKKSDAGINRVGLMNKEAITVAYYPLFDELGQTTLGKSFADRPYIPLLKQTLKPLLSEVAISKMGAPVPRVGMFAPVIKNGTYSGYITVNMNLRPILEDLGKSTADTALYYTLLDKAGNVIKTNRTDQAEMKPFLRGSGTLTRLDKTVSQWIPTLHPNTAVTERWKNSLYVTESTVGDRAEWKLILEQPVAPFQKVLYENYAGKMTFLFLIFLGALILAEVLSRRFVDTLGRLGVITHQLPEKLTSGDTDIVWPESAMEETNLLIVNFDEMAHSLKKQLTEVTQSNESLEVLVMERSTELQVSEQRFRSFVENVNDVLFVITPEGRFSYVSPQWKTAFGYELSETVGQSFLSFVHADDVPGCLAFLQHIIDAGEKDDGIEYRARCKDGSYLWYRAKASRMIDPVQGMKLLVGIGRDITEKRQSEEKLRQFNELLDMRVFERTRELQNERQRLASILSGTSVGTWEWNVQTGETVFNERWAEIIGYTLDEISPVSIETWMKFAHPEDLKRSMEMAEKHFRGELDHYEIELRMKHKDGNFVWVLDRGKVMTWTEDGKPLLMMGIHQEITEKRLTANYMGMSREILQILNMQDSQEELLRLIFKILKTSTEFDAVGIRLQVGDDFPYVVQEGFSNDFLITENSLAVSVERSESSILSATRCGTCLECGCGLVLSGMADPLLTEGGSLYTNKSFQFLGIPPERDSRVNPRNKCTHHGYNSIALIPIRNKEKVLGLIQLNDRRKGCFTPTIIELLEGMAAHIGAALIRKQGERLLLESKARIDELSEQNGTVIWEVDDRGLYTFVSHTSEMVFGYRPEEMIGLMHVYDLFPEPKRESSRIAIANIFAKQEQIQNFENHTITKNGHQLWWVTNGIPILGNDGTLLGYRGSDTDITESKKLKEQLQQSQKMEAVGQLAGGLAHDFNNVLSIINGYCCLLQMDVEQNEKLNEYIGKILAASYRAGDLTHSMLAFSRTQVMNPQNQNLNAVVAKTASFIEKIIGDHIQFKTIMKETNLPVFVDGGQIEQILINLANNARDAMPNGGELVIATEMMQMNETFIIAHGFGTPGQYAVITVSDTGTGMDDEIRKKIFEPFFTTKAVDKGTGLGLAMVYGITKQHNGFVDVTSAPGHGASFMVYLPIVSLEALPMSLENVHGLEAPTGTETILIAEDNADLREFMRSILAKLGYRVIVAADGQEAVDMFTENMGSIQLVITDMIMPYKSGKVAYDEILQLKPDTRALFSSGYSAKIIQQQGELGEFAEFISKPVQPAQFLKKVREMLDR